MENFIRASQGNNSLSSFCCLALSDSFSHCLAWPCVSYPADFLIFQTEFVLAPICFSADVPTRVVLYLCVEVYGVSAGAFFCQVRREEGHATARQRAFSGCLVHGVLG